MLYIQYNVFYLPRFPTLIFLNQIIIRLIQGFLVSIPSKEMAVYDPLYIAL